MGGHHDRKRYLKTENSRCHYLYAVAVEENVILYIGASCDEIISIAGF